MKVYIDGSFYEKQDAKISVFDHGLLYGDGVFEGIRAYDGRIFELDKHLHRFKQSAEAIFLSLPMSLEEIQQAVIDTVRQNNLRNAYIRLISTRGVGDLGLDMRKCHGNSTLIIIADKIKLYSQECYDKGLSVVISSLRQREPDQLPPGIKSLNYLPNVLAHAGAVFAGAEEAVLLNHEGYVAECSADNIFYVYQGRIYTPPVYAGILEGITREIVMRLAEEKMQLPVVEKLFTPFELCRADEVFLTGTGAEVIGVVKVDGHVIGSGIPGPVTKQVAALFREYASQNGTPIDAGISDMQK